MSSKAALIVVDMQNDFCPPNGPLAVEGARDIAPMINGLISSPGFAFRVATKDYHPKGHISFASNHQAPNDKPFESFITVKNLVGGKPEETMQQRLWPVHCVQGSEGAEIIEEIDVRNVDLVVNKGMDERVEMYSAFTDSFGNVTAGSGGVSHDLAAILHEKNITDVYVVGVAGDYCVKYTALGAAKAQFKTYLIEEAQRSVDPATWPDSAAELKEGGVDIIGIDSPQVAKIK